MANGYNINDGNAVYVDTGGSFSGGGSNNIPAPNSGGGGNPTSPNAPTDVYNTQNLEIQIGIQSNPQDGIVLVDGVIQNVKSTPTELRFNQKELLTPKQITLQKSGVESSDVYKVYTLKKENRKQSLLLI